MKIWIEAESPTFGTCAGMILLAKELIGKKVPDQISLRAMDTVVHRNFFGSQLGSFVSEVTLKGFITDDFPKQVTSRGVFIRAPVVAKTSSDLVEVLGTISKESIVKKGDKAWFSEEGEDFDEVIVAVKQNNFLATSFHPELTQETIWHESFVNLVRSHNSKQQPSKQKSKKPMGS